jgi:hypothetical protein
MVLTDNEVMVAGVRVGLSYYQAQRSKYDFKKWERKHGICNTCGNHCYDVQVSGFRHTRIPLTTFVKGSQEEHTIVLNGKFLLCDPVDTGVMIPIVQSLSQETLYSSVVSATPTEGTLLSTLPLLPLPPPFRICTHPPPTAPIEHQDDLLPAISGIPSKDEPNNVSLFSTPVVEDDTLDGKYASEGSVATIAETYSRPPPGLPFDEGDVDMALPEFRAEDMYSMVLFAP